MFGMLVGTWAAAIRIARAASLSAVATPVKLRSRLPATARPANVLLIPLSVCISLSSISDFLDPPVWRLHLGNRKREGKDDTQNRISGTGTIGLVDQNLKAGGRRGYRRVPGQAPCSNALRQRGRQSGLRPPFLSPQERGPSPEWRD